MDTDNQLLEKYARSRSERAFRELVERRINLVHSAALRETNGDVLLAEDITQAVFTELARHAAGLLSHPALSGWLYTAVRRTSANVRRSEHRRQRREQEVFAMNELLAPEPMDNIWQQVRPVLDDVMHELSDEDRTAVVLRFFEGRSLREVGVALHVSENAARMRVERALEKMHQMLAQRGVKSTVSGLAAALSIAAVLSVPSTLAATVATGAMSAAATGASAAVVLPKLLSVTKAKIAVAAMLSGLIVTLAIWHRAQPTSPSAGNAENQASAPGSSTAAADSAATDDSVLSATPITNASASSQMILRLLDAETGQPVANAKLHLFYMFQDGRGETVKGLTDTNGELGVRLIERPFHGLNMFVSAEGHVPKVTTWGFGRSMPAEYTMKLERSITIGGVVVDEGGQAIPGATIEFDGPGNNDALQENIQFGPDTESVTGADGRWFCNMIPKEMEQVSLHVTHPTHAETSATIRPNTPEATKSIITMKAGFTVAGTIRAANGYPIGDAQVREVRLNEEGEHTTRSDASGAFEFKHMKPGQLTLAVQVQGFAPAVQTIQVSGTQAAVQFQLGPAQLLRGRVTDEAGNPIANAWAETTRGRRKIQWSATTDGEGRFEWDSAPEEALVYSFQAEGFERAYAIKLQADGSEHQIKLAREQAGKDSIQITGTVVDADTGEPLDEFKVLRGDLESDWAFPLRFLAEGKDGKLSVSFPAKSSHPTYQIQIEKEGYIPGISGSFSEKEGNKTLEFRLQKGSGPSGVVLLPNGAPAENATVLLCTPLAGVTIDGPAHVENGLNTTTYRTQTDAAGKFSLPAAPAPQGLIIIHEQGFAELPMNTTSSEVGTRLFNTGSPFTLESTDVRWGREERQGEGSTSPDEITVTLEAWGRIEGRLVLDAKPAENENIKAYNHTARYSEAGRRFTFMTFHLETKTDASGEFSIDKVPPGRCNIFRQQLRSRTGFESHEKVIQVKPGEVTKVTLGGSGTAIVGKAFLSGASIDWQSVPVNLRLKTGVESGPRPKRAEFTSRNAYIAAMERFFALNSTQQRFGTFCESDGSFRVSDIPSGRYELQIKVRDSGANSVSDNEPLGPEREIGAIVREVIIPELNGDQAAEPLDLGNLELESSLSAYQERLSRKP